MFFMHDIFKYLKKIRIYKHTWQIFRLTTHFTQSFLRLVNLPLI